MTVDNGVSSIEGVKYAKQNNIKVLVTDHHLPGHVLPEADAMVNPNLHECDFPSKALAGVGVAFYLMAAVRAKLRQKNSFAERGIPEPNLSELLDLVALARSLTLFHWMKTTASWCTKACNAFEQVRVDREYKRLSK